MTMIPQQAAQVPRTLIIRSTEVQKSNAIQAVPVMVNMLERVISINIKSLPSENILIQQNYVQGCFK